MKINTDPIKSMTDIPTCLTTKAYKQSCNMIYTSRMNIIKGWPFNRNNVKQDIQPYMIFRDELVMIKRVSMKARESFY